MDILTVLAWIAFAVAAMYLIRFIFESMSLMAIAISIGMNRNNNQSVDRITLGARPLWFSLVATIVGIVFINL